MIPFKLRDPELDSGVHLRPPRREPLLNDAVVAIAAVVAVERGVLVGEIFAASGGSPRGVLRRARDESILRCRERYGYSSSQLARYFGVEHSTVLAAYRRARKEREQSADGGSVRTGAIAPDPVGTSRAPSRSSENDALGHSQQLSREEPYAD